MGTYVKVFAEMTKKDFQEAGGKAANLGELTQGGFRVPPGFCITSPSLPYVIEANGLAAEIDRLAASIDYEDYEGVENITGEIRALIENATIPADLDDEIRQQVAELTSDGALVAVRSSVALKDTPISSFPGMMDTFHYIKGADEILRHVRMCWASVWTARAAFNRLHHDIDYHLALIAPVVQRMVDADIAGIMFTANPLTGSRDEIVIESNWGLGESVVSGKSMNDFFALAKADLAVITRRIARKTVYMCFDEEQGAGRKEMVCTAEMSEQPTLQDADVHELGEMGLRIESWFGQPQDIEWAYEDGTLYLLQSRNVKNLKEA
jgi:pyruvate,water dikinase